MDSIKYDTIIIGAGLGGLITGAMLAKKGKSVLVLEQHSIPGGCATVYERHGVRFEVGLHEMDFGSEYMDMKHLIFKKLGLSLPFVSIPQFFTVKTQSKEYVIPEGVEEAKRALKMYFPNEKKGIDSYYKEMKQVALTIRRFPQDLPFFTFFFYPLTKLLTILNLLKKQPTVAQKMSKFFTDNTIQHILNANCGYYHDDPCTFSWFYHSIAQYSYYQGAVFIKGGSQVLSDALVECIQQNKGTITLRANVVRILLEGSKAVGVVWKDRKGEEHTVYGTYVVANCGIENIYNGNMLPQEYQEPKVKGLENSVSLYTVYVLFKEAFSKYYPNNAYSTFIRSDENLTLPLSSIKKDLNTLPVEERDFVFVDYSVIDSGLVKEGDPRSFAVLTGLSYLHEWEPMSKDEYIAKKERLAQTLFGRLETYYPGLKQLIDYYEVSTPKTIKRYTKAPEGTAYGFKQDKYLLGSRAPRKATQVKNLYYTGAFTFPGGGFSGAILSGYLTAERIAPSYGRWLFRIGGSIVFGLVIIGAITMIL